HGVYTSNQCSLGPQLNLVYAASDGPEHAVATVLAIPDAGGDCQLRIDLLQAGGYCSAHPRSPKSSLDISPQVIALLALDEVLAHLCRAARDRQGTCLLHL